MKEMLRKTITMLFQELKFSYKNEEFKEELKESVCRKYEQEVY